MATLLFDVITDSAESHSDLQALTSKEHAYTYAELAERLHVAASAFAGLGLSRTARVSIYLPKTAENVLATFATMMAGGIAVPVNPVLKGLQVAHILKDSGSRFLVTSRGRLDALLPALGDDSDLDVIVLVDEASDAEERLGKTRVVGWQHLETPGLFRPPKLTDADIAAIFYTSGSTGKPKGVVLSHRNMVVGAESVAGYIENSPTDVILAMLPLSFDAGFSQLTTGFFSAASVHLIDFLLPGDVVKACARHQITGLTGVPPLWMQLTDRTWPDEARLQLRYFANTGGKMPRDTLAKLRQIFPNAQPFLMYGLTEAFRSTYLPPEEVDRRPDSIGKAIPNAEILVVGDEGQLCGPNEPGELVHVGPLVSQGYWNDRERTESRYRPPPARLDELPIESHAVWSGDTVKQDDEGYLYFVGRRDDMIKTSGYRVSPTEIEELAFESGIVAEGAALGISHARLGQAIVLVAKPADPANASSESLTAYYQARVPAYMVPKEVVWQTELPRNPNGKIDRQRLARDHADLFSETGRQ